MGPSDDLTDVMIVLFLLFLGIVALSLIWSGISRVTNPEAHKYCPIDDVYGCKKEHYPGELANKMSHAPKEVISDSIYMPSDPLDMRQSGRLSREQLNEYLKK